MLKYFLQKTSYFFAEAYTQISSAKSTFPHFINSNYLYIIAPNSSKDMNPLYYLFNDF